MTKKNPAEFFQGKTVEDLAAIECGGRVLIPDALRTVNAKGEVVEHKVLVRVPTPGERSRARADAVAHVGKEYADRMGRDREKWTVERAKAVVGPEVFDDLDTYAIVARSLFEPTLNDGKPQQAYMLQVLYDGFSQRTVFDMWDRINLYADMFDPRIDTMDEGMLWGAVEAIAKVQNLSPLAVIAGSEQPNFIVRMAVELSNYRKRSSILLSPETSTLG